MKARHKKAIRYADTRGRTVMQAVGYPQPGETFTIAGIYELDRRWWRRALHWLLRRPAPRTKALQVWKVTEIVGSGVKTLHAGQ